MENRRWVRILGLTALCVASTAAKAALFSAGIDYPIKPRSELTPGSLCSRPSYLRHPERIPYCNRNVDSSTKKDIIAEYDLEFDYRIQDMNRGEFKIDHLIPLCIGGSNHRDNLWPQHETAYVLTDELEHKTCEWMGLGKIKQKEAIDLVLKGKNDPAKAPEILRTFKFVKNLTFGLVQ